MDVEKKLSVLFVAPLDLSKTGAGVTHFEEVCQNMVIEGHAVYAICPGYQSVVRKDRGFSISFVPTLRKSLFSYLIYEFLLLFYLPFVILSKRPDCLYVRHTINVLVAPYIAWLLRVPVVLEENGVILNEMKDYGWPSWVISIARTLRWSQYQTASKIICVTNGISQELKGLYGLSEETLSVVENGVNTDIFKPLDLMASRRETKIPTDKKVIGFVGSFAPWQGLEYLLDSLYILKNRGLTDILLVLVGDGPLMSVVKVKIKDMALEENVMICGWVPYDEIGLYVNSFDICVAPFQGKHSETASLGSPLKLYEYIATGKRIIASDIDGVREVENVDGRIHLVPPRDSLSLANTIEEVLLQQDDALPSDYTAKIYIKFSWNAVSKRISGLINEIVSSY